MTYCLIILLAFASHLPSDEQSVEEWQEDIHYLVDTVQQVHPDPWSRTDRETFIAAAEQLRADLPDLSEADIGLRLLRLMALLKDGHSSISILSLPAFTNWIPWRVQAFPSGLYVTALPQEHAGLVGSRVVSIGSTDAEKALEAVVALQGVDNRFSGRERAPHDMSNAGILQALDIIEETESLQVTLEDKEGKQHLLTLRTREDSPRRGWFFRQDRAPFESMLTCADLQGSDKPMHLDHRDAPWWLEYLPDDNACYMQFSAVQNGDNQTFQQFLAHLFETIEKQGAEKLIIDLRYNGGGNGNLLWPLIYELIRHDRINQPGRLFVLIGPKTFSAAVMAAVRLEQHTEALLVGEPLGAGANHYGDARTFRLPNSNLPLRVSTLFWQEGHPADDRSYFPPDFPAVMTAEAYFSGRDPALEAVLEGNVQTALGVVQSKGIEALEPWMNRVRAENGNIDWWIPFEERGANSYGYELLRAGGVDKAIIVFDLIARTYPDSWNAWDSLGEAHLKQGNLELAKQCYETSLKLNPGNDNGKRMLSKVLDQLKDQQ